MGPLTNGATSPGCHSGVPLVLMVYRASLWRGARQRVPHLQHAGSSSGDGQKEPGIQEVTLLSDDSDDDVPPASDFASLTPPPSQDQPVINPLMIPHSSTVSQPPTSRPPVHPDVSIDRPSVVQQLKLLATRPRSKNILKSIDYEFVRHEKVDYLPSVFDGDVIFESLLWELMLPIPMLDSCSEWTSVSTVMLGVGQKPLTLPMISA